LCFIVKVLLKIFDKSSLGTRFATFFGANYVEQDIKKALELASVCEHPNAVWLTKLVGGRDVASREDARQLFLGCENDPRALCFVGGEVDQAAKLGDAFAQALMADRTFGEVDVESFRWAEKSAAQGERDGFYLLGRYYRDGIGCQKGMERAKENYLFAAELGRVNAMVCWGVMHDKYDPQQLVWLGRAASSGESGAFLREMRDQIHKFGSGTGLTKVVFVIGRALNGQIDNKERTVFGSYYDFETCIGPANQALRFYNFQLQSYQKAVDSWTIIGLRNNVVKDVRKMIGKIIWDAREEAAYLEKN
jgi:hypothetical protein